MPAADRNRFHAICPYFAMFPEAFVRKHLIWAREDDIVLDPFSGRGTTMFEALLAGHKAIACDLSPVAVCISRAKSKIPAMKAVLSRLTEIERAFDSGPATSHSEFFRYCFHRETLGQILHLRRSLDWKRSSIDCFLAAVALGRLHGESNRSEAYFSNQMPRTISTKPGYSVRWWKENGYEAPRRDVFAIMRSDILYRYQSERPTERGRVRMGDIRKASELFSDLHHQIGLVITSPPYLDTTNFLEDQWLRLWLLGGTPRSSGHSRGDHRHVSADLYWKFLSDGWKGIAPLLRKKARIVVRIGGCKNGIDQAEHELRKSLKSGLERSVKLIDRQETEIRNSQAQSFRPNMRSRRAEYDFHWCV
jgi:hypothetical protein